MEGNKRRAFDSLISTPPVSAASTSSKAFDALISTPSGDRRPGSEFTNVRLEVVLRIRVKVHFNL